MEFQVFGFVNEKDTSFPELDSLPNILGDISKSPSMDQDQVRKVDSLLDSIVERTIDTILQNQKAKEKFLSFQNPAVIKMLQTYKKFVEDRLAKMISDNKAQLQKVLIPRKGMERVVMDVSDVNENLVKIADDKARLSNLRRIYTSLMDELEDTLIDSKLLKMKVANTKVKYRKNGQEIEVTVVGVGPYDGMDKELVQIQFDQTKFVVNKRKFISKVETDFDLETLKRESKENADKVIATIQDGEKATEDALEMVVKPMQQKLSDEFERVDKNPSKDVIVEFLKKIEELQGTMIGMLIEQDLKSAKEAAIHRGMAAGVPRSELSNVQKLVYGRTNRDLAQQIDSFERTKFDTKQKMEIVYREIYDAIGEAKLKKDPVINVEAKMELTKKLDRIYRTKLERLKGREYAVVADIKGMGGIQIKLSLDLPLYETVPIHLTPESRIKNSPLAKFQNLVGQVMGTIGGGQSLGADAMRIYNKMKKRRESALSFAHTIGTKVAREVVGAKGERAVDRFIKRLSYNAYTNRFDIKTRARRGPEEMSEQVSINVSPEGTGGTPGTTFNLPGTVTTMGDPVAPTKNSDGSGDNFNPKKKKKKKKKKSTNENKVMSFHDFIALQNK